MQRSSPYNFQNVHIARPLIPAALLCRANESSTTSTILYETIRCVNKLSCYVKYFSVASVKYSFCFLLYVSSIGRTKPVPCECLHVCCRCPVNLQGPTYLYICLLSTTNDNPTHDTFIFWVLFWYPLRRLLVRYCKSSTPLELYSELYDRWNLTSILALSSAADVPAKFRNDETI